mmetsp:Transcript_16267/g.32360  ORF Transcript_16267/g.32360 Transcript_16267/m.32360 type:complete len:292 (+) Transcript_16267:1758-2633(+)
MVSGSVISAIRNSLIHETREEVDFSDKISEIYDAVSTQSLLSFIEAVGKSIPKMSGYFIQYIMFKVFIGAPVELYRLPRLFEDLLHRFISPQLTDREKTSQYLLLRPIFFVRYFFYPDSLADQVFYLSVVFVYAVMCPLVSYICFLTCIILTFTLGNQFFFVYPSTSDSGGKYFDKLISYIVICMIIGQILIMMVMAFELRTFEKKLYLTIAMVPLLIFTISFWFYLGERHYLAADFLPLKECSTIDKDYKENNDDFSFLFEKYKHPAMKVKPVLPDNIQDFYSLQETQNM